MKKTLYAVAGLLLFATAAQAAVTTITGPTIDFPITVTINEAIMLQADIDPGLLAFFNQVVNTNVFSNGQFFGSGQPRATVMNIGGAQIDLNALVVVAGGMTLGTTLGDIADNQGVLAGIFTYYNDATTDPTYGIDMVLGKYADDDVLGGTARVCTATDLSDPADPDPWADGQFIRGFDVDPGHTRTLRFMLQTPSAVSAIRNIEQTMTVTVGGQL
ncbi:hypothetical protein JW933_10195 [candidate division FCPU426 bacterium]|nr:hypothetical protein [candidate division FCPU426 bacterium]